MELKAQTRKEKGRKTDNLREQGIIPVVLYGENVKTMPLQVNEKEFLAVLKEAGESSLVKLNTGDKVYDVLIHQIAKHPLTEAILHVDFYRPSTKKQVEAEVEIVFVGEAPAVKNLGAVLMKEMHQIKVKGLAKDLPREIEIDISVLANLDDKIEIKDLTKIQGITFEHNDDDIVVHTIAQKEEKEEEPAPSEAVVGEEGEEGEQATDAGAPAEEEKQE